MNQSKNLTLLTISRLYGRQLDYNNYVTHCKLFMTLCTSQRISLRIYNDTTLCMYSVFSAGDALTSSVKKLAERAN